MSPQRSRGLPGPGALPGVRGGSTGPGITVNLRAGLHLGLVFPLPSHPRTIHKPVTFPELATSLVFPQGISPQMLPAWHSSVIKSWGSDPGPHGSCCPDRAGRSWSREQHPEDRGNRGDWKRCRPEVDFTLTAAAHLRKQSQGSAFQGEDVKSLQEGQPFTATTFNPKHYYIPFT